MGQGPKDFGLRLVYQFRRIPDPDALPRPLSLPNESGHLATGHRVPHHAPKGGVVTRYFSPGALVRARGREWIVPPSDDEELLRLRRL